MRCFRKICAILLVCLLCTGCAESSQTEISLAEPEITEAAAKDISGSYNGSWEMFNCGGQWSKLKKFSWNCWAEISDDKLLIWDEDLPDGNGLADLTLDISDGDMTVKSGKFMDMKSGFDSWRLSLENDDEGQRLVLRGSYDGEVPGGFSFVMYLEKESK